MKMTKADVYRLEHEMFTEALSLVWEFDKPEDKIYAAYYAAGVQDMAGKVAGELDE